MRERDLSVSYSFVELIKELEGTFMDQNVKQMAHMRLTTTRQEKSSLTDFIQVFELNAEEAGYAPNDTQTHYNTFLVETLENLVNGDVRAQLYAGGIEVPEDYQGLKRRLMAISQVMERKKLRAAQQSQMFGNRRRTVRRLSSHHLGSDQHRIWQRRSNRVDPS